MGGRDHGRPAGRRNAEFPTATFQTASLHEADLDGERFDKIFAIHVPVFDRGDPARELAIVRDHLARGGHLFLSFQPLDGSQTGAMVDRLTGTLAQHGFTSTATVHDLPSGRAACLKARLA